MSIQPDQTGVLTVDVAQCLEAVSSLNQCGVVVWSLGAGVIHVSDIGRALLGFAPHEPVSLASVMARVAASEQSPLRDRWLQAVADRRPELRAECTLAWPDGRVRRFSTYACLSYRGGVLIQSITAFTDITQQCEVMEALSASEARLEEAQEIASLGHWELDMTRRCAMISEAARRILLCDASWQPSRQTLIELVPEDQRAWVQGLYQEAYRQQQPTLRYEVRHLDPDGSTRDIHTMVKIDYAPDGRPRRLLATIQDISELRAYGRQLHNLSFFDPTTQLPNRALFIDRLAQGLTDAAWNHRQLGVVMLDLDRFKDINDSMGHAVGDTLLRQVAERLQHVLRGYDTVARLGGDEFAVVLPGVRHATDLGSIAQKVLGAFATPFELGGQRLFITASVGGAIYPEDAEDVDQLMQYADAALYHAKSKGRNNFQFYSRELTHQALERLSMEAELRKALAEGQLELYYQPKFDLLTGGLVGAEALMRWNHPQRGMVPPLSFISLAEDTGLIVPMGAWALQAACAAVAQWNTGRAQPLKLAVNLSARQFAGGDFLVTVRDALANSQCHPAWLELEITESLLLDGKQEVRALLESISALGVSIAIDDFGTGYSALSYLTRFPVDTLKIDRAFVKDMGGDHNSGELVKAIVSLGHSLGMVMVAEGVETQEQAEQLRLLGCEMVQGFLFGKPMPLEAFLRLL